MRTSVLKYSTTAVLAEKQMEDVKTGPKESESAAPADQTSLLIADGGPMEMTGSLSEANALANVGPPSPLTGCYLLIIIGEPHSEDARRVIIEQLKQGTNRSWWLRNLGVSELAERTSSGRKISSPPFCVHPGK